MDVVHARCAGLDVHKDEVVACVRVEIRRRVQRIRQRFPTTLDHFAEVGCGSRHEAAAVGHMMLGTCGTAGTLQNVCMAGWSGGMSTNGYSEGGRTLAISRAKLFQAYEPHESSAQMNPPFRRYSRKRSASSLLNSSESACQSMTNGH